MSDYRDDLPTDYGYVDRRVEREQWRLQRVDVEARWLGAVLARLRKRSALTWELAEAAEIKPGQEYSRFLTMLNRHCKLGRLRKVGQRQGKIHLNNIWQIEEGT